MTAIVRLFSPHDAGGFEGVDRRKAPRLTTSVLPVRTNCGGVFLNFGSETLHQFFGQVGQSDPHTRLSQTILFRKGTMGEVALTMDQKTGDGFAKVTNAKSIKPSELVEQAASWAADLTNQAERKTGTTETALEVVARQTGVNQSTLWRLRYRRPKDLAVSVYMKLKAAFEAAEQRQYERSQHEAAIAGSLGTATSDVLSRTSQLYVDFYEGQTAGKIANGGAGD